MITEKLKSKLRGNSNRDSSLATRHSPLATRFLNAIYLVALLAALPWLLWRSWKTGRYRKNLRTKLLGSNESFSFQSPPVWFHAVSVGEVHLLRTLVSAFIQRYPGIPIVVSSTTDTGLAEARKIFPNLTIIAFPFDFSWAVRRTLHGIKPRAIILAESELWPNFLEAARQQNVPVIVVNGRMSPRSAKRIKRFGSAVKRLLHGKIAHFAMQTEEYAENLRAIGIDAQRISVVGSMKYDGALRDPRNPATLQLREQLKTSIVTRSVSEEERLSSLTLRLTIETPGLDPGEIILVAGSTHAPEEEIILGIYRRYKPLYPQLRLILVPRSPDRFRAVAELVEKEQFPLWRRSEGKAPSRDAILLFDTLGELSTVWGLADIAFTGGSFDGRRGGQSMIEPAGYGIPTIFGPHIWNFRDTVERLVACKGGVKVETAEQLESQIGEWLEHPEQRREVGRAARELIEAQQGATEKTMDLLEPFILAEWKSLAAA